MSTRFIKLVVQGIVLSVVSLPAVAAAFTTNFDTFRGDGFAAIPSQGQLDSDYWSVSGLSDGNIYFGEEGTSGDFARGTSPGGETIGGIYAFEISADDFTLGIQPTGGDFTPGFFTLRIANDTGFTVPAVEVSYDVYNFNDGSRANSFNFSWSLDNINYSFVSSLDFTSPETADGSPAWAKASRSTVLTGLNWENGSYIYFRWSGDDISGIGDRDEFALDNLTTTPIPIPSAVWLLGSGLITVVGLRRRFRS